MSETTGFLIFDVSDDELELLRAVRDTDFAGGANDEVVERAVGRGLIDRVAGSYGGFALATPGLHTLWNHDRPAGLTDEPWERCQACGNTDLTVVSALQADRPLRAVCRACGFNWTRG